MNPSQTNSRAGAQPNRFRVYCFVGLHLCISLGKYLVVDLDLVTLFTSYPGIFTFVISPSCFASNIITANWVFKRLIQIPLSTPAFLEVPWRSISFFFFVVRHSFTIEDLVSAPNLKLGCAVILRGCASDYK